ncbi:hypothetical protein, partial [Pseudomonas aeruginosa]|uniref:hypothetical protein n=1 Tax=Pseudomonas aeruginosa TaxID=287 RepID=UPI003747E324
FISNITTIIVQDLHAQELFPKIHELKRAELKFVRANLARMSRLGYVCAHGERSEPKSAQPIVEPLSRVAEQSAMPAA